MGYVTDVVGTAYSATNVPGTAGIPLNLVQAGTAFNNRIGRVVTSKHLLMRGMIQAAAASLTQEYLRLVIVWDHQPNKAAALWSDVMTGVTQTGTASTNAYMDRNTNNMDRFTILLDRDFVMPTTDATGASLSPTPSSNEVLINELIDIDMTSVYGSDSNPAVIGDITTGAILLFTYGSVGSQNDFILGFRHWYSDALPSDEEM